MSQTKNTDNSPKTNSDEIARSIIQPIVDQAAGDSKGGGTKPPLHHNNHNHHNIPKSDKSDTKTKASKQAKIDNNAKDEPYNSNNKKSSSNRNIVFHPDHPEKMDFDFSSTSTAHSQSPQTSKDATNNATNPSANTHPHPPPTEERERKDSHNPNPSKPHKENSRNGSATNKNHDPSKSGHKAAGSKKEATDKAPHANAQGQGQGAGAGHKSASSSSLKSLTANLSREQRRERRRKLEDPNCFPKRFEVQVQARVRVGMDLSSQHLTDLPEGSVVTVEEIMNRRARISRPLCGWLSVTSKFGARIILPTNSKYSKIGGKVMFKRLMQGQQVLANGQYPNQAKVVDYNEENSLYKVSYADGNTQWIDIEDANVTFISQHKAVKVQKPLDGTAPTFTLQTSQAFFNQFFCKDYPQYQAQSSSTTRHMDISPVSIPGGHARFSRYPHNNTGPPLPHGPPHAHGPPQGYPRGPPPPDGHHGPPTNPYPPHPRGPHPPPGPYPPPGHPHSRGPPRGPNMYGPPPPGHGHPGNGSGHPPPGPYHARGPMPRGGIPPPGPHSHGPYGPPPPGPPYGPSHGPGPQPHSRVDDAHHSRGGPPPNGPNNVSNGTKNKDKNKGDSPVSKTTNEEFVNKVKEIERRIIQHLHQRGYDESHPDYHRYLQKAKELAIQKAGKEREKMLQQQRQREAAAAQNKGVTRQEYEQYLRYRQEKQRQHAIAEQQRKQRIAEQQQQAVAQRAKQQNQNANKAPPAQTAVASPPGNDNKLTSPSKTGGSVKGLIVLRGLPGSGKTTLAKKLAQRSKNARICTEDRYHWSGKEDGVGEYKFQPQLVFLAREWCTKEIRECIQSNVNLIILDNHNARISMYEDHIQYAVEHGYRFRIIEFVATASLIDKYRSRSYKKFPREVYVKLLKLWEHDPRTELINPTFGDNVNVNVKSHGGKAGVAGKDQMDQNQNEDKGKNMESGAGGDGAEESNEDKLSDNVEQEQNQNNNLIDYSRRPLDQGLNISNKLNNDSQ